MRLSSRTRLSRQALLPLLAAIALAGPALAQGTLASVSDRPQRYRLAASTTHETGCFGACRCPIMASEDVSGSFSMRRAAGSPGPLFDELAISDFHAWVTLGTEEIEIRGSGRYRVGGEVAVMERLELDLQVGEEPSQPFDSGWIVRRDLWPAAPLRVSLHGEECVDTVIELAAEPIPRDEIGRYGVRDGGYQEGCFPPCLCPLLAQTKLIGRFALADVSSAEDESVFAVTNVVLGVRSPYGAPLPRRARGSGLYLRRSAAGGEPEHRLRLWLRLDAGEPVRFDSDWMPSGKGFPDTLDIDIARNGFYCYDQVFEIRARHRGVRRPRTQAGG